MNKLFESLLTENKKLTKTESKKKVTKVLESDSGRKVYTVSFRCHLYGNLNETINDIVPIIERSLKWADDIYEYTKYVDDSVKIDVLDEQEYNGELEFDCRVSLQIETASQGDSKDTQRVISGIARLKAFYDIKDFKIVEESLKEDTIKKKVVKEAPDRWGLPLDTELDAEADEIRRDAEDRISKRRDDVKSQRQSKVREDLDKLDPEFGEIKYGGAPLPGGESQREAFITNDPDMYKGYSVGIGGDINNSHSDNVFVYVYSDDEDDGYIQVEKKLNYYQDLDKAVDLANKLFRSITPEMTHKEVEKLGHEILDGQFESAKPKKSSRRGCRLTKAESKKVIKEAPYYPTDDELDTEYDRINRLRQAPSKYKGKFVWDGKEEVPQDIKEVTIEDGVTWIRQSAFEGCSSLTSVTIPRSVTEIGDSAFYGCRSLLSVTIPDSVTEIGYSAFFGCKSLTSMTIPGSVTKIGGSAFASCDRLVSVAIPDSVTSIGGSVFAGCKSLTSIEIPDSVTSIGDWAFWSCKSLTSIEIPDSVIEIDDDAFRSCPNLTIRCSSDSYAYKYAQDKGIPTENLTESTRHRKKRVKEAVPGTYKYSLGLTRNYEFRVSYESDSVIDEAQDEFIQEVLNLVSIDGIEDIVKR